jgi:hypothetical protein
MEAVFAGSGMQKKKRVVLIVSLIMERPMCLLCIAGKTGETKLAVVRSLESIGQAFLHQRRA